MKIIGQSGFFQIRTTFNKKIISNSRQFNGLFNYKFSRIGIVRDYSFTKYAHKIFRTPNIFLTPDTYMYVCVSGGKK